MMTGMITAHREAALSVIVRGLHGQEEHVEAVIDTGFNGFMVLPNPLVATLGLPYHTHTMATLADGTTVTLAIYKATCLAWARQQCVCLGGRGRSTYRHGVAPRQSCNARCRRWWSSDG